MYLIGLTSANSFEKQPETNKKKRQDNKTYVSLMSHSFSPTGKKCGKKIALQ